MKLLLTLLLCCASLLAAAQTHEERAVAAILMAEAWSEGVMGMTAVAEVIHQRVIEKKKTPLEVISARRGRYHAFSCLNGSSLSVLIEKFQHQPDYTKALQIAQTLCRTPAELPGLTNSANHFTRKTERPYWARGIEPVAVIGQHAFYRLEQY